MFCSRMSASRGRIARIPPLFILLALGIAWAMPDPAAGQSQAADLWSVRAFRNGLKTDYAALDARVAELVKKYESDPAMQGRVYLEALKVHALSGLQRTDLAKAFAEKAEQCPLPPVDKAQLYLSWGDAAQMSYSGASGNALRAGRREAAALYLKSMRVALDNQAPETLGPKPSVPSGLGPRSEGMLREGLPGYPPGVLERLLREQDKREKDRQTKLAAYRKASSEWNLHEGLISRRDFSRDMTVKLYATLPFDTAELEQLATEILDDQAAVADLVNRTKARIKQHMDKAGWKLPENLPDKLESKPPADYASLPELNMSHTAEPTAAKTPDQGTEPPPAPIASGGPPSMIWFWVAGFVAVLTAGVLVLRSVCHRRARQKAAEAR